MFEGTAQNTPRKGPRHGPPFRGMKVFTDAGRSLEGIDRCLLGWQNNPDRCVQVETAGFLTRVRRYPVTSRRSVC